jgi:N-acetylneuraminate lyase
MDYLSCINFMDGKYEILGGRDENLLSALVLGTRAAVGSTYNYAAPLYYQLIAAYEKGDLTTARKLQQMSINMIRLLGKYGGIATGKAFMKYIGLDIGQFRSPIKNMNTADYKEFVDDVRSLHMQEYFSKI